MRVTGTAASKAGALLAQLLQQVAPDVVSISERNDTVYKRQAEVQVGEYTGTGASQDVTLDFDPIFVITANLTDGDEIAWAFNTASVGTKSQSITGAAGPATLAAQGIVFGTAGQRKFTLGTDASVNETAKVYQFFAVGA